MSEEVAYRDIMYKIACKLTKTEAQDIAILYKLEPKYEGERALIILVQLEKRQIISESSPANLVELLRKINREDLAKEAAELSKNRSTCKGKKSKSKSVPPNHSSQKPVDWTIAEFAIARIELDKLVSTLTRLQSEPFDPEITQAIKKLYMVNKHLSDAERKRGLPTTRKYIDTFSNSDDESSSSSSGQSSLTSNVSIEDMYETLTYGQPQSEVGSMVGSRPASSSPEKSRPPLPAPKPKRIAPRQSTEGGSSAPAQFQPPRIPLPGLVPRSPNLTRTFVSNDHETVETLTFDDDNTGDSGHGTGSDYGFSDPQPFLRKPLSRPVTQVMPSSKGSPLMLPPKPSSGYMTLSNPPSANEYATRQFTSSPDDSLYSTARR